MFNLKLFFLSLTKKMWPKVTVFALLSIFGALLAVGLRDILPDSVDYTIEADTIGHILNILASSMLAVTTFSLSTLVSAYGAATNNVTPRATRLITQDPTSQNVLATFIGSFLFSLVGIVALGVGVYEGGGRLILFGMTLVVIALILITLIKWIDHITRLGRVSEMTKMVEEEAEKSIKARAKRPCLGGRDLREISPGEVISALPVMPSEPGYVQYLNVETLASLAAEEDCRFFVQCLPGSYATPNRPLLLCNKDLDDKCRKRASEAFVIAEERSFEQDPRFGLCVMSEIASRALSIGINDPGTAIDVVARQTRILSAYLPEPSPEVQHEGVWVPRLDVNDLFEDAFHMICRDGASSYEVMTRLQKNLCYLHSLDRDGFASAAVRCSKLALEYASKAGLLESELAALQELGLSQV